MSKSFNQLTTRDPVCIRITTKNPITSQHGKTVIKKLFQEVICANKVQIVDIAFENISFVIESAATGDSELYEKQNIYICFDKWISREPTTDAAAAAAHVSFTSYMNEMSEAFANDDIVYGESFLYDICDLPFDVSDWQICYYDNIHTVQSLLYKVGEYPSTDL